VAEQKVDGRKPGPWLTVLVLGAILLVGGLLRASYLGELVKAPDFDQPVVDPGFYDYWARAILSGDWTPPAGRPDPQIPTTPFAKPPGYPYFLALAYWLTGGSYLGVRIIQMALGLTNVVLMFLLGRAVFAPAVGLVAAGFAAIYWIFIYFEGELNSPAVVLFLLLAAMNVLASWPRKPTWVRAAVPGLLLGLLTLIRPESLAILPIVAVWGWFAFRPKVRARGRLVRIGLFLACAVLAIAPVTVRNYLVSNEFCSIAAFGGLNLYASNNELADGVSPKLDVKALLGVSHPLDNEGGPLYLEALRRKLNRPDLTYAEFNQHVTEQALRYIASHPGRIAKLVAKKALLFWGPAEVSNNKVHYYDKRFSPTLRFLPGFPWAAGLGILGVALLVQRVNRLRHEGQSWPPKATVPALLVLYVFMTFVSFLPFFVVARYRVPVIPILLLFAAYAVCRIAGFLSGGERSRAARWALLGAGLVAAFSIPLVPYSYSMAKWHHLRGVAYAGKGDFNHAIEELLEAAPSGDDVPDLYANLAGVYLAKADYEAAAHWYREGLRVNPSSVHAETGLGMALDASGDREEALAHFEKAVELNALFVPALVNLGTALANSGQPEGAEAHLREAVRLAPGNAAAACALGRALGMQEKTDEAAAAFRKAIENDPDSGEAYALLGYELAKLDKASEAVEAYRRAVELRPDDTESRIEYASLLSSMERYDAAAQQFAQAAQARPDNAWLHHEWGYALFMARKPEQAVEPFRKATRLAPETAAHWNSLGMALAASGNVREAEREFERALTLDPNLIDALNNLGNILASRGDADGALARFQRVLELSPGDERALHNIGVLKEKLGIYDNNESKGG